jgi:hypothetical protein
MKGQILGVYMCTTGYYLLPRREIVLHPTKRQLTLLKLVKVKLT